MLDDMTVIVTNAISELVQVESDFRRFYINPYKQQLDIHYNLSGDSRECFQF